LYSCRRKQYERRGQLVRRVCVVQLKKLPHRIEEFLHHATDSSRICYSCLPGRNHLPRTGHCCNNMICLRPENRREDNLLPKSGITNFTLFRRNRHRPLFINILHYFFTCPLYETGADLAPSWLNSTNPDTGKSTR
jgi:hypothetical protein